MKNIFDYIIKRKKSNDIDFQYENYDDTSPKKMEQYLEGMHTKKFLRVKSEFFEDLITNIRDNPNCFYTTYMNDIIKSGQTPEYLSALIKHEDGYINSVNNEVLASRICNFMQIPTVYNKKLTRNGKNFLLSVDFLKGNEKIVDTYELLAEIKGDGVGFDFDFTDSTKHISRQLIDLRDVISMNKARSGKNAWKFDVSEYLEDYINMFLIRKFIIGDQDFFPRNFCNIVDNNGNMRLGPVYDCELSFGKEKLYTEDKINIEYVNKHYPYLLQNFCNKYSQLMENSNFNKLFDDIDDQKYIKITKKEMKNHYKNFMDYCHNIENQNEKETCDF